MRETEYAYSVARIRANETALLAPADIEVSITAFAQLATGALSLRQAAYRDDVRINAPCPAAEALFTGRPQYIGDHY